MRTIVTVALAFCFLTAGFGCASFDGQKNNQSRIARIEAKVTRQEDRLQSAAEYQEQSIAVLKSAVRRIQDDAAAMNQRLAQTEARLIDSKRRAMRLEDQVVKLGGIIESDRATQQKELDKMMEQLARDTAKAINSAAAKADAERRSARPSSGGGGPVGAGEFYEHKVEKGHTLSAIAKAYGVQISDIKRANNLKGDVIRLGQKLYIPKK